jgi:hypothetical protein
VALYIFFGMVQGHFHYSRIGTSSPEYPIAGYYTRNTKNDYKPLAPCGRPKEYPWAKILNLDLLNPELIEVPLIQIERVVLMIMDYKLLRRVSIPLRIENSRPFVYRRIKLS